MHITKKGWKKITDPEILKIYNEVCDRARELDLLKGGNPPLYSHKSYRTLGTCHSHKEPDGSYSSSIVLSEYILSVPEHARSTIIHEVGHATAPRDHHGHQWKTNTNMIGHRWNYTASRCNPDEVLNQKLKEHRPQYEYKYEVYCPDCGATWKYKSQCKIVKNPSSYRCGKCKVDLKVRTIQND